jgi:hypothetical protein
MFLQNRAAIVPINAHAPMSKPAPKPAPKPPHDLAVIFAPPTIDEAPIAAARRAVDRANAAVEAANSALADVAKKYPPQRGFGDEWVEPAALASARQNLARAEDARQLAHAVMAAAISEREKKFHADVMHRFERAAPHLAAAAEALAEVVNPMTNLHQLAWRYRLPVGRLLAEVPRLQESVRVLTMLGNVGMEPAAPVAKYGDDNELAGGL